MLPLPMPLTSVQQSILQLAVARAGGELQLAVQLGVPKESLSVWLSEDELAPIEIFNRVVYFLNRPRGETGYMRRAGPRHEADAHSE